MAKDKDCYDSNGHLVGYTDKDGYHHDSNGYIIGYTDRNGFNHDSNGHLVGYGDRKGAGFFTSIKSVSTSEANCSKNKGKGENSNDGSGCGKSSYGGGCDGCGGSTSFAFDPGMAFWMGIACAIVGAVIGLVIGVNTTDFLAPANLATLNNGPWSGLKYGALTGFITPLLIWVIIQIVRTVKERQVQSEAQLIQKQQGQNKPQGHFALADAEEVRSGKIVGIVFLVGIAITLLIFWVIPKINGLMTNANNVVQSAPSVPAPPKEPEKTKPVQTASTAGETEENHGKIDEDRPLSQEELENLKKTLKNFENSKEDNAPDSQPKSEEPNNTEEAPKDANNAPDDTNTEQAIDQEDPN